MHGNAAKVSRQISTTEMIAQPGTTAVLTVAFRKCVEIYSNDVDGDGFDPDETFEDVGVEREWSIMGRDTARDFGSGKTPRLTFSIEEAGTIDFGEIPSRGV